MPPEIQFAFLSLAWIVCATWLGARSQRRKRERKDANELRRVLSARFGRQ